MKRDVVPLDEIAEHGADIAVASRLIRQGKLTFCVENGVLYVDPELARCAAPARKKDSGTILTLDVQERLKLGTAPCPSCNRRDKTSHFRRVRFGAGVKMVCAACADWMEAENKRSRVR